MHRMAGGRIVNYRLADHVPAVWRLWYILLTHYSTASFAGNFFMLTSTQYLVSRTAVPSFHCVMLYYMLAAQLFLQPQPEPYLYSRAVVSLCYFVLYACCSTLSSASARTLHVQQCRSFIVLFCILCLLLNSFFSLSPNLTCTAVPSFHCVMLYYMLAAQLFLQPQSEPYMYSSAVVSLCYFVFYVCCSTLSSASVRTLHVQQSRRFIVLFCIICLLLNSFFSLSPNLTCTAEPSFHCVILYYMFVAQLFLQPQPVPHTTAEPSFRCVMLYYIFVAQLFLQPQPKPHM